VKCPVCVPKSAPRQHDALEGVARYIEQAGYPPTVRELGEMLGLASSHSAALLLNALARKGCLEIRDQSPRAIRITQLGRFALALDGHVGRARA
jgi:repressor LexA